MAAWVISGDESIAAQELAALLDNLVGDNDRAMMVDSFDCADPATHIGPVVDSITTIPMFTDRRIVVLRSIHSLATANEDPGAMEALAASLESRDDTVDVIVTVTGALPKALSAALKGAEKIGASVGTSQRDRTEWVEVQLVEAGLSYAPNVPRTIALWLGGDHSRLAGLVKTLVAAYGESAKLSHEDVEAFLGDAGSIAPWDLTDAIDDGDTRRALVMLHRFLSDGKSHPLQIIAILSNRYAQMMQLDGRDVRSAADAMSILGGKEFTARKILEQYKVLGGGGVARALAHLANADADLKGRREWPGELVMEVLVGRLCQLAPPKRVTSRRASS